MLNPEENALLTRVGPGARMGALLRRHWLEACPHRAASRAYGIFTKNRATTSPRETAPAAE